MRKGIKKKRSETMKLEQIRHTLLVGSEKGKESNKRIWDLREKRHKGVEKGDKAFLEPTRRSAQAMEHGKGNQQQHSR